MRGFNAMHSLMNRAVRSKACNIFSWFARLTLQTDEAKVSMRFGEIAEDERNKIIIVSDVAKGSEADKVRDLDAG